jgi:hypothetical protein
MQYGGDLAMASHEHCGQDNAFKIVDAGPLLSGEKWDWSEDGGCNQAFDRWLTRGQSVSAHDLEILTVVCEVPK